MLLKVLRDYLLARQPVSAMIANRLIAGVLPQGSEYPAADMRIVNGTFDHTLSGLSGLTTQRVIFDCYAKDPEVADDLADKMMRSGIVGARWTADGVSILVAEIESGPSQSTEGVDPGTDEHLYVTSFTLSVTFARACR